MVLIDADGRECRAAVMVQERIPADPKPQPTAGSK